jgi:catechol-2,3-dioxygenase
MPASSQTETEELPDEPRFLGVRHAALLAKDGPGLAVFYREVMGMRVVRETGADHPLGAVTFLALNPEGEDHDVVLVPKEAMVHTAFRVASLADLLAFYRRFKERGIPVKQCLNHIVEFAVYFEDPEKNLIEVYWVTGWSTPDTYAEPINFELSEAQLHLEVEHLAAKSRVRRL